MVTETFEVEGHLVDSGIMTKIFDYIVAAGFEFDVEEFRMGRTNRDFSRAVISVKGKREGLGPLLSKLHTLGCTVREPSDAVLKESPKDSSVPPDFYSTTNHRTSVRLNGKWTEVAEQRMDGMIVVRGRRASVRKLREIRAGDMVVCGMDGVRIQPTYRPRDRSSFEFMAGEVSSERVARTVVGHIAEEMRMIKEKGGRIAFVAGPVVVHTGGVEALCRLIRAGYVSVLLGGNALAVHDIEYALYGTSLGARIKTGEVMEGGHRNHLRAINEVFRAGSIKALVGEGTLNSGVMYECVRRGVPFHLAGSLRDDGPLPEVMTDMNRAQEAYADAVRGVSMVIMLSTMLHSIATGNMLPSWVRTVCVDINPAVVTKLADRGTAQAVGVVTDVGLFLENLSRVLYGR